MLHVIGRFSSSTFSCNAVLKIQKLTKPRPRNPNTRTKEKRTVMSTTMSKSHTKTIKLPPQNTSIHLSPNQLISTKLVLYYICLCRDGL